MIPWIELLLAIRLQARRPLLAIIATVMATWLVIALTRILDRFFSRVSLV